MCCISIEILSKSLPAHFYDNGKLFLDLQENTDYTTVRFNEGLTFDNKNEPDQLALSFSAPYTAKNKLILEDSINPNTKNQSYGPISIKVLNGANIETFRYLQVVNADDNNGSFNVQLTNNRLHPLVLADQCTLCEITDLGEFELSKDNLEDHWFNNIDKYVYQDGDNPWLWYIDYFGGTYNTGYLTPDDIRPRYSPLGFLQKGFAQKGWCFRSPILETEFFRRLWAYLSDKTYGGNRTQDFKNFTVSVEDQSFDEFTNECTVNGDPISCPYYIAANGERYDNVYNFFQFDIEQDPNGSIDNSNSLVPGTVFKIDPSIVSNYHFQYCIRVVQTTSYNLSDVIKNKCIEVVRVAKETKLCNGNLEEIDVEEVICTEELEFRRDTESSDPCDDTLPPNYKVTGDLKIDCSKFSFQTGADEYFYIRFNQKLDGGLYSNTFFDWQFTGKAWSEAKKKKYTDGDIINMSEPLTCDVTLNDLFKGMQHLTGGQPVISWRTKTIILEVPYDVKVFLDNVEGILKNETQDIVEAVQCASRRLSAPNKTQCRYVNIGFKQAKDKYIDSLEIYDADTQPYDRSIDLGQDYNPCTQNIRNPLFEPTLLNETPNISNGQNVHLSWLVDNLDGDISFDIGPRIGLAHPPVAQGIIQNGQVIGLSTINWMGDETLLGIPFYFHTLQGENFETSGSAVTPNLDHQLIYGKDTNDLFQTIIGRKLLQSLTSNSEVYSVYLCLSDYSNFDLYKKAKFQYKDKSVGGHIQYIRYNHCTNQGEIGINTIGQINALCLDLQDGDGDCVEGECECDDCGVATLQIVAEYDPQSNDSYIQFQSQNGSTLTVNSTTSGSNFVSFGGIGPLSFSYTAEIQLSGCVWTYSGVISNNTNQTINIQGSGQEDCECPPCEQEPPECDNSASLDCVDGDPCDTWMAVITSSAIVDTVTFEYRYKVNGVFTGAWTSLANTSPLSTELCDPTADYQVRMRVSFEPDGDYQCPDIVQIGTKAACSNDPIIDVVCVVDSNGDWCAKVVVTGDINSDIDTITTLVTIDGIQSSYIIDLLTLEGPYICGITQGITVDSLFISYIGSCEDFTLENPIIKTFPPIQVDCDDITASLVCVKDGECWRFERVGFLPFTGSLDRILYQFRENISDPWSEPCYWKGDSLCHSYVRALREVRYCDDRCPPFCSAWVECSEPCDCATIQSMISVDVICDDCDLLPSLTIDPLLSCSVPDIVSYDWRDSNNVQVGTSEILPDVDSGDYTVTLDFGSCTITSGIYTHVKPDAGPDENIAGK